MSGKEQCSPFWSFLAPTLFILLWSGGFTALKAGLAYAEPITYLALRFGVVLAVLLPLFLVMRPPLAWLGMALATAGVAISNRRPSHARKV
jgi:drug/metabolite transporter (DMT)-like permease